MRIDYTYCEDCTQYYGSIEAQPEAAIAAAVDYLGACETKRGYIYLADETDEAYRITRREMLMAGAAILAGKHDWYSIWCAETGTLLSDRTKRKYFHVYDD